MTPTLVELSFEDSWVAIASAIEAYEYKPPLDDRSWALLTQADRERWLLTAIDARALWDDGRQQIMAAGQKMTAWVDLKAIARVVMIRNHPNTPFRTVGPAKIKADKQKGKSR